MSAQFQHTVVIQLDPGDPLLVVDYDDVFDGVGLIGSAGVDKWKMRLRPDWRFVDALREAADILAKLLPAREAADHLESQLAAPADVAPAPAPIDLASNYI